MRMLFGNVYSAIMIEIAARSMRKGLRERLMRTWSLCWRKIFEPSTMCVDHRDFAHDDS